MVAAAVPASRAEAPTDSRAGHGVAQEGRAVAGEPINACVAALFARPAGEVADVVLEPRCDDGAVVLTRPGYSADRRTVWCWLEVLADTGAVAIAACERLGLHELGEELLCLGMEAAFDRRELDERATRIAGLPADFDIDTLTEETGGRRL